ncbi:MULTISPECIES: AraC family transcriptional regulator [Bacillus]|uniref:AraC family transcriptional regulator n=1 Tax=Bacillus TaxID=1386 RepID=UPI00136341B0|nr:MULTISPECIES: AraC family transcriptional regulator [Bacillus]MBT9286991.1 AraC family transcriptional regulator [Bacillus velezensis]MCX2823029.1 AraC family transcriptional regulator [Bacillus sp. H1F1]NUI61927.1 helix-turn-helix transcriptional regulator [Bacillus amyloliquefaciens]QHJ02542.1 AraC family transcriptional regulator [Bacillus sp. AM1(2019)]
MNRNQLMSGKIALNQYVHHAKENGAHFHIHYWGAMPKHYNTLVHKHSFFEFCFVLSGEGRYLEEGRTYPLMENTMFVSRPGVLHQIKSDTGLTLLYVAFELLGPASSPEWNSLMKEVERSADVIIQVKEHEPAALLWKTLMVQAAGPGQVFMKEILTHMASSLILALLQTAAPLSQFLPHQEVGRPSPALLTQVKLHIKDNLSQPLQLADVSRHFHISGRHLSRLFVSETGVSYSEFVRNERVRQSASLLKSTELSIKQIAEEVGLTIHYFTRVFKSQMGSSPGEFRSLYKKANAVYPKKQVPTDVSPKGKNMSS